MQVLLIEDAPDFARPLTLLLERAGCEVTWVSTAAEALWTIKDLACDIIISDLWLSDADGLTLMPKLLSRRPCPAIALSGDFLADQLDRLKAAGFASFARKPVDVDTLLLLIRRLVGHGAPAYAGTRPVEPAIAPSRFGGAIPVLT